MFRRKGAWVGSLLVLLSAFVFGECEFMHVTSLDGLSHGIAYGCVQDFRGFIWIATENGLNCANGYGFRVYQHDPENSNSPTENNIGALIRGGRNDLWFGTWGGGVNRLDLLTGRFSAYRNIPGQADSLSDDRVQALFRDRANRIWVGTYSQGLNRIDPETGKVTHYPVDRQSPFGLSHQRVWAITQDRAGCLWVGTGDGLNHLDPATGRVEHFFHIPGQPGSLPNKTVRSVFFDRSGRLWVGTEGGLGWFDTAAKRFNPTNLASSGPQKDVRVNTLLQDHNGVLWVGTNGRGLFAYDLRSGMLRNYVYNPDEPAGIGHNDIRNLFEDASGVLWICTRGRGVDKLDLKPERFSGVAYNPKKLDGLSDGNVRSLCQDRSGALWVGTENGLNRSADGGRTFTRYLPSEGSADAIPYNRIRTIREDAHGALWVSTWGGGLAVLDPERKGFRCFRNDPADPGSLSHDRVNAVLIDNAGTVWAGTDEGLNRWAPERQCFVRYYHEAGKKGSLSSNYVTSLFQDRTGALWVGTENGLNVFSRTGEFRVYQREESDSGSLLHNRVTTIYEDARGDLWVGTVGGLNRFERANGRFERITDRDGLPNSHVCGILSDARGRLWVSTARGLSRFDPLSRQFRNYDAGDGLRSNEFFDGACLKTADGRLWFGGTDGYNMFFPDQVVDNPHPPPVVLTAFSRFDKEILSELPLQSVKELTIPWQDNFFSFEFAALDFTRPQKNRYAYKLEGFDQDWVYCGTRHFASYTNLDGGDYVFRVKGTNNDGVWSPRGVSLLIRVETKPWKTWWAWTLYALAGLGVISGYVAIRTRSHRREIANQKLLVDNLKRVDRLKDEFLSNTSHELRSPINGIVGLVDGLLGGASGVLNEQAKGNLTLVSYSARRLFHLVQDIMDFAKLRNRDISLVRKTLDLCQVAEVVLFLARPLFEGKGVALVNEISPEFPPVEADENRLQQILHKLVENAAKYTEAGSVTLSATVSDGQALVSVRDTGKGMPRDRVEELTCFFAKGEGDSPRNSLGLSITRYLVELHGGRISLESVEGEGTAFNFTLPLSAAQLDKGVDVAEAARLLGELPAGDSAPRQVVVPAIELPPDALSILVVDDEIVFLQVLVHQLTLQLFRVVPAVNGVEAMEKFAAGSFDLVITDTVMPKLSGFELCRKIRERFSMFDLPVIMLTEKNQPREILAGFEAGANDYISKPFDKKELEARVKTLLSLKQAVQRAITNARHLESEQQQRLMSETLRDLTRALSSTLNTQEVLARLLENMGRFVGFDAGLALYREGENRFQVLAACGEPLPAAAEALEPTGLTPALLQEIVGVRKPLLVSQVAEDQRLSALAAAGVRSWMAVPLLYRGEMPGIIVLKSSRPNAFSAVDAEMAFTVAGQAGIAVENSKMFTEIKRMAVTDGLTGINNRRYFFDMAEVEFQRSLRYARPLVAVMADIDHFKHFNDTYGHAAGDEVLRVVAARFQRGVRRVDLLCRFGGEEFALLLPETALESGLIVAERLRESIAMTSVALPGGDVVAVTISVGAAALTPGVDSLQSLLDKADSALYASKNSGRNRVTAAS